MTFKDYLEKYLPVGLVVSSLSGAATLKSYFDTFGYRATFIGILLVCLGWAFYVQLAKQPAVVHPDTRIAKFSWKHKSVVWACVLSLSVLVGLSFWMSDTASATVSSRSIDVDENVTPPGGYPSIDEIKHLPTKEEVSKPSAVKPEDVNFKYRNASGVDLKLILFNCYCHYFPLDDPLAAQTGWRSWDFPATNRFTTCSDFGRGTGWYVFFVERYDNGKRYQLGTKNIFYSEWPTLTVTSTEDEENPFKAEFGVEE